MTDDQQLVETYGPRLRRYADLLRQRRTLRERIEVIDKELAQLRYEFAKKS
jgi:hypothetical protein